MRAASRTPGGGPATSPSPCAPPQLLRLPARSRRVVGERRQGDAARRLPRPAVGGRAPARRRRQLAARPDDHPLGQQRRQAVRRHRRQRRALGARPPRGDDGSSPPSGTWGETRITARDQTRFLLHIDQYVVASHRAYAMRLLAGSPLAAVGYRRGGAEGLEAVLQGRLGLRHGPARPPGGAPHPRMRARLDRRAVDVRRLPRLRQGDAGGLFGRLLRGAAGRSPGRTHATAMQAERSRPAGDVMSRPDADDGRQIGAPGFEPGTSSPQRRRATRLRYAPR